MSEQSRSRIDEARARAATVKRRIAAVAGAAFVVALGLAYASHPGDTASASSAGADEGGTFVEQDDDAFEFGFSDSIAPSVGGAPQVRTSVS
jgi:hypothetical protein